MGVEVAVGVEVGVAVGVSVGVSVAGGGAVGVGVTVCTAVLVGVTVLVGVDVLISVAVGVEVGGLVAVGVGVAVGRPGGVAGVVSNGHATATNLPWQVSAVSVADVCGVPKVTLLNDLEAAAHGMLFLAQDDLVVLQARDPVDAIRRRARRLQVLRRGRVIAKTPPLATELDLSGRPAQVDYGLS